MEILKWIVTLTFVTTTNASYQLLGSNVDASDQACKGLPKLCDVKPTTVSNGNVTQIDDDMGGIALEFTCYKGYLLMGKPVISCCDGYWKESFPKCVTRDCKTHLDAGKVTSKTYIIFPEGKTGLPVHCDMTTNGGGWTVIQRRQDNNTNFYRNWADYQKEFGEYNGNFWIGLDNLHELTKLDSEIYVYMKAEEGQEAYARYSKFRVNGEEDKYRVQISGYDGNAGNSMDDANRMMFSTYDSDNDIYSQNCPLSYKGGWWYSKCHGANPNGLYLNGSHPGFYAAGINWRGYKGYYYSMKYLELKIRRK